MNNFNPRTHVGCDNCVKLCSGFDGYFNPRTHVGCDATVWLSQPLQTISIHAPTWGATGICTGTLLITLISIHAPTWGATESCNACRLVSLISIHAPTWGATPDLFGILTGVFYFNPRTHVGCDPYHQNASSPRSYISIHAPTWGATGLTHS